MPSNWLNYYFLFTQSLTDDKAWLGLNELGYSIQSIYMVGLQYDITKPTETRFNDKRFESLPQPLIL